MASLVLLLSELVRHHEPNFGLVAPSTPSSSCGASMSCTAIDASKYEPEIVEEDQQELKVSVDLVWP
ncbi:hypothetical protein E1A91_A10G268800v1 [Gossypium mustelinum]|uniref:Uncharacterized protein n=1 Tax=Gossypium mustelinum TaxID=34275 RepID=A0A5D2XS04_GOSMU|nr:hypothetical protein E1A91_A10G268800v1 [Gossypium mustelinum]